MRNVRLTGAVFLTAVLIAAGCNKPQGSATPATPPPAESNRLEAVSNTPDEDHAEPAPAAWEKPTPSAAHEAAGSADAPPPPSPSGVRTHVVQRGETLWGISQKYYGDGKGWQRIYSANRNRIRDPKDVPVGTKLIIP